MLTDTAPDAVPLAPPNGCDAGDKPAKPGKGKKLRTLSDLDRRTKAYRHASALRDKLIGERGGPDQLDALQLGMIESYAITSAMVTDIQTRWLSGDPVTDVAALVSLINARGREAQFVGAPQPRDVTPRSLREAILNPKEP